MCRPAGALVAPSSGGACAPQTRPAQTALRPQEQLLPAMASAAVCQEAGDSPTCARACARGPSALPSSGSARAVWGAALQQSESGAAGATAACNG